MAGQVVPSPDDEWVDAPEGDDEWVDVPQKKERSWGEAIADTAVDALPIVGGIVGGIAGAPLGPLAIGTAAIGGAGGEGWKRAINSLRGKTNPADETPERVINAVKKAGVEQGAGTALGMGGAAIVKAAAPTLRRGAVRMMTGSLKPDRGYLQKMAGARRGGIAAMEKQIGETALDAGVSPSMSGLRKTQQLIDDTDARRLAKILAAPNTPISGSAASANQAARRSLIRATKGDAPQSDIAAVRSFIDDLQTSPRTSQMVQTGTKTSQVPTGVLNAQGQMITRPTTTPVLQSRLKDLTPRETAETIRSGNERLRGLFGGDTKNAEIQARLRVQGARTRALDRAAGTRPESDAMKRLIDLRNILNATTRRADANNAISLTDVISLSAGRPAVLAASMAMKPRPAAFIAHALNKGSKAAGALSKRESLLARLLQGGLVTSREAVREE